MSKTLQLYNTFTRTLNPVKISGKLIAPAINTGQQPVNGSFYICGPTVYSDCHVGHAMTYVRADLFRRFMKTFFNVRLDTVMNITDIDDKVLAKTHLECKSSQGNDKFPTQPLEHPFSRIGDKYYRAFLDDLASIRVMPADLYVRISKHIHIITSFIQKLEEDGHAYQASNGDVHFNVKSLKSYVGRTDSRNDVNESATAKRDPRDFVLWKSAKPNEPVWEYRSTVNDKRVSGRPGWHVQCSAIASAVFGNELDFHFGGKDLIFPHHYNEEACCCAFHSLNSSESIHVWAKNWLHSGHLFLGDAKMSKSLGNVVAIKDFINYSSVNALRLLCVYSHYRSDLSFNDELLERIKAVDHKISAFGSFLVQELHNSQENLPQSSLDVDAFPGGLDIENTLRSTYHDIVEGVCDDFHLDVGLESILNLSKLVYSKDPRTLKPTDLIATWTLLREWCETCGLEYAHMNSNTSSKDQSLIELLSEFRNTIRTWALKELKTSPANKKSLNNLLKECDSLRTRMDELGFVIRDNKVK